MIRRSALTVIGTSLLIPLAGCQASSQSQSNSDSNSSNTSNSKQLGADKIEELAGDFSSQGGLQIVNSSSEHRSIEVTLEKIGEKTPLFSGNMKMKPACRISLPKIVAETGQYSLKVATGDESESIEWEVRDSNNLTDITIGFDSKGDLYTQTISLE